MKKFNFFKKTELNRTISIVDENNIEQLISIEVAQVKFGIKWLEYDDIYTNIYQKLQIRYMDSKLGWGLFAKCDIKEGELIGLLTGEVYFQDRNKEVTSKHIFLSDAPDNQFQVVDASNFGNLTRFIQHLPTEDIVSEIKFQQEDLRDEVATCNIKHSLIQLGKGIVTEFYTAAKFIKEGEILGSNYDSNAWLEELPLLLKKNGSIIDNKYYNYPLKSSGCPKVKYVL